MFLPPYVDLHATELSAYIFFALLFTIALTIGFWAEKSRKKRNKEKEEAANSPIGIKSVDNEIEYN